MTCEKLSNLNASYQQTLTLSNSSQKTISYNQQQIEPQSVSMRTKQEDMSSLNTVKFEDQEESLLVTSPLYDFSKFCIIHEKKPVQMICVHPDCKRHRLFCCSCLIENIDHSHKHKQHMIYLPEFMNQKHQELQKCKKSFNIISFEEDADTIYNLKEQLKDKYLEQFNHQINQLEYDFKEMQKDVNQIIENQLNKMKDHLSMYFESFSQQFNQLEDDYQLCEQQYNSMIDYSNKFCQSVDSEAFIGQLIEESPFISLEMYENRKQKIFSQAKELQQKIFNFLPIYKPSSEDKELLQSIKKGIATSLADLIDKLFNLIKPPNSYSLKTINSSNQFEKEQQLVNVSNNVSNNEIPEFEYQLQKVNDGIISIAELLEDHIHLITPRIENISIEFSSLFATRHTLGVTLIEIIKDSYLLTYGLDNCLRFWNLETSELILEHKLKVKVLTFIAVKRIDGKDILILSTSQQSILLIDITDINDQSILESINEINNAKSIHCLPDRRTAVCLYKRNKVEQLLFFDIADYSLIQQVDIMQDYRTNLTNIHVFPSGKFLAIYGQNIKIYCLDYYSKDQYHKFKGAFLSKIIHLPLRTNILKLVACQYLESVFFTTDQEGYLRIWDLAQLNDQKMCLKEYQSLGKDEVIVQMIVIEKPLEFSSLNFFDLLAQEKLEIIKNNLSLIGLRQDQSVALYNFSEDKPKNYLLPEILRKQIFCQVKLHQFSDNVIILISANSKSKNLVIWKINI